MKICLRAVAFAFAAVGVLIGTCVIDAKSMRAAPPVIFQFR